MLPKSICHKAKAAPNEPPASPAAGCIHILSKIFSWRIFPFATQFKATPPAKHKFLILYSLRIDLDNLIVVETRDAILISDKNSSKASEYDQSSFELLQKFQGARNLCDKFLTMAQAKKHVHIHKA